MNMDFSCPLPIRDYKEVLLAHGGGGRLTRDLIEKMFYSKLSNDYLNHNHDGAILEVPEGRVAFTTDSYVVHPLFFPGGDIGALSVHGTVNDLAMCGAQPRFLSLSFIIEEGFAMQDLWRIVCSIEAAARDANVMIVTGDTKVVDRGKCDGIYINTAGIGHMIAPGEISPTSVKAGDRILVSGPLGNHGMAIMALREGLKFETEIRSDSASVAEGVAALFDAGIAVHCLRDPTRGGLASSLNEIASQANLGIAIQESAIPITRPVQSACEVLGLDPLYVASEGRFLAFVAEGEAQKALDVLREHEISREVCVIGEVTGEHPGLVVLRSKIGGSRVVDMLSGEQLPRIC